jgi:hypothetical protein
MSHGGNMPGKPGFAKRAFCAPTNPPSVSVAGGNDEKLPVASIVRPDTRRANNRKAPSGHRQPTTAKNIFRFLKDFSRTACVEGRNTCLREIKQSKTKN